MYDRPRAERKLGATVIYDRMAGYCRELSRWERAALLKELAALAELDEITDGKIPERPNPSL